jgi:hypothetical protein
MFRAQRDEVVDPNHFEVLTAEDVEGYRLVQQQLRDKFADAPRSSKIADSFRDVVDILRRYVMCEDKQTQNRRGLVCGIVWIGSVISINTRQLCKVIGKCKSSVNSGFHAIGYQKIDNCPVSTSALVNAFPFMRDNFTEARQWTFRKCPQEDVSSVTVKEEQICSSDSDEAQSWFWRDDFLCDVSCPLEDDPFILGFDVL